MAPVETEENKKQGKFGIRHICTNDNKNSFS